MYFQKEAKALLDKMREDYSDQDCWKLGYEDDDGTSGYFQFQYTLRLALDDYLKNFDLKPEDWSPSLKHETLLQTPT